MQLKFLRFTPAPLYKSFFKFNSKLLKLQDCAYLYLRRGFSNIFLTLTDLKKRVVICKTSGSSAIFGPKRKKRAALALEKIVKFLADYLVLYNIRRVILTTRMKINRYYYCLKKELHFLM